MVSPGLTGLFLLVLPEPTEALGCQGLGQGGPEARITPVLSLVSSCWLQGLTKGGLLLSMAVYSDLSSKGALQRLGRSCQQPRGE